MINYSSHLISFAVFRAETEESQRENSETNYGGLINRLFETFSWTAAPQNFQGSMALLDLKARNPLNQPLSDLPFLDWLNRTCIEFLRGDKHFLLILDSCISIPEDFEKYVIDIVSNLDESIDAVAIWPTVDLDTEQMLNIGTGLVPCNSVSELAFLISRGAARKFVSFFDQNPVGTFSQLISNVELSYVSLNEDDNRRPYVFLDINSSQIKVREESQALWDRASARLAEVRIDPKVSRPKVQAYLSHWFSTWESIEEVEKACKDFGYTHKVLNTTQIDRPGWVNSVPISFFRQVEYACSDFDENFDFMLFITADVRSPSWVDFFTSAEKILAMDGVGSFSPTLTNEWNTLGRRPNIFLDSTLPLAIVPTNDLIVIYLHKSIVLKLRAYFKFFAEHEDRFEQKVGYQITPLMNRLIYSSNLFSLRDRRFTFMHPFSRSYDAKKALEELTIVRKIEEDFLLSFDYGGELPTSNSDTETNRMIDRIRSLNI